MVDKLFLLSENFWKLSTSQERKKLGDILWFDNNNNLLLICCSWWPDSLFLAVFVYRYRHIVKWLPLSITKILHFNHWSHETDQDASFWVKELFWSVFEICYWEANYNWWIVTETMLRKQRYQFFTENIQKFYNTLQSVSLCQWHHLNDRIENSFLHIDRWTWIKWIANMSSKEKKRLLLNWELLPYTLYRPLLSYTKDTILLLCNTIQLPFVVDVHNNDVTQKRIRLRKTISKLSKEQQNLLYTDRSFIYSYCELKQKEKQFFPVFTGDFRPTKQMYSTNTPDSIEYVQQLLSRCWLYTNISKDRLHHLLQSFCLAQAFYLQWRWFLQRQWQTYFCFTWSKKRFWEECNRTEITIWSLWHYIINWIEIEIKDSTLIGGTLCFSQVWDKCGSESFTKWASKNSIPFFWRRSIPIVKKNNIIKKVFTNFLQ